MRKKNITPLLICAVMLLVAAPPKAFAQTLTPPPPTFGAQAKPAPTLRATFAGVATKSRDAGAAEADIKRLGGEWLNPQSGAQTQSGYTRKQKILVASIVAGIVVLAVVLALNSEKGGHSFCDIDPADPDCIGAR